MRRIRTFGVIAALLLSGCTAATGPQPTVVTVTATRQAGTSNADATSVQSLITSIMYGETQAFHRSVDAGIQYDLDHDYPGFINEASFRNCAQRWNTLSWAAYSRVADLATVRPDPNWLTPKAGPKNVDIAMSPVKPKGDTYSVTVTDSDGQASQPSTVHVTIIDGVAYDYNWACV